jgi:hypothetical protein
LPILRDAALRAAPQDEVVGLEKDQSRTPYVAGMRSLAFSAMALVAA